MRSKSANRFLGIIMTITKTKHEDLPNDVTLAAMREAESGKDAGEVKLDSIESFVASMM